MSLRQRWIAYRDKPCCQSQVVTLGSGYGSGMDMDAVVCNRPGCDVDAGVCMARMVSVGDVVDALRREGGQDGAFGSAPAYHSVADWLSSSDGAAAIAPREPR